MKINSFLKINLVIVLCLGFSAAVTGLYAQGAQKQKYAYGDLGKPPDYAKTTRSFRSTRALPTFKLPSSYRVKVTPAKDQGQCGSCWAFASVGVLESRLLQDFNITADLSEQQLISCDSNSGNGCSGGYMTALKYWFYKGPMYRACTGYCACNQRCESLSQCPVLGNRTYNYYTINVNDPNVNPSLDANTSILKDGAAYFAFEVYSDFEEYWDNGSPGSVYTQKKGNKLGGHAVLIFGWDDTKQAWLCKNSWGSNRGPNHDGTFWMAYTGHKNNLNFAMANVEIEQHFKVKTWLVDGKWGTSDYTWVGDFNGDKKADIASASYGNVYMKLSTGTGFVSQTWTVDGKWGGSDYTWVADFNGDGKTDIASAAGGNVYMKLSTGTGFNSQTWTVDGKWGLPDYTWVGDFNGDNIPDIASGDKTTLIGGGAISQASGGNVYMKLSTGTGFISQTWTVDNNWGSSNYTWVGDFNGDNRTDIASASGGNVFMKLSTGTGFDSQTWTVDSRWGGSDYTWVGDFDGDGKTDIASASGGNVYMKWSQGNRFKYPTVYVPNNWGTSDYTWVGNFSWDGKTVKKAVIASARYGNVYMKTLSGMPLKFSTWLVANKWGTSDYTWVGDFNGDEITDIASASGANVYMSLSQISR
jgi:C1A family cysteine protease